MKTLVTRAITGIIFVAVLVYCIMRGHDTFGGLFLVISALSTAEFCSIVNKQEGVDVNTFVCSISAMLLFAGFYTMAQGLDNALIFLPYLLSLIYLLVGELYWQKESPLQNWAYTMLSQLYVALPFALLNFIAFQNDPQYLPHPVPVYRFIMVLAVFLFLWASDSGAYLVGCTLSRYIPYKLFPRVSPNKSWIGSIGGGLLAIGVAALVAKYDNSLTTVQWMGFALTVVVFGTWGDLVESLLKRQLGIKDSGHVLPGHGGMLDRFDSSLLAIPAVLIYLSVIQMHGLGA